MLSNKMIGGDALSPAGQTGIDPMRQHIRREAVKIANDLIHASINADPSRKCTPVELAKELADVVQIVEDTMLIQSPDDKTAQAVSNANQAVDNAPDCGFGPPLRAHNTPPSWR